MPHPLSEINGIESPESRCKSGRDVGIDGLISSSICKFFQRILGDCRLFFLTFWCKYSNLLSSFRDLSQEYYRTKISGGRVTEPLNLDI